MSQAKTLTPGAYAHLTCNIVRGQYLLPPTPRLTAKLTGIIRKSQKNHGMRICATVALTNHIHLLVYPENQTQLSGFMHEIDTAVAKLTQRLHGLRGRILEGPFVQSEAVDDAAVLHEYRYILSNSCKENLVADPRKWPGVHSASELCGGPATIGEYFDSKRYKAARVRDHQAKKSDFIIQEAIELSPIPQHQNMTRYQRETANRKLVQGIVREAAEKRGTSKVKGATACIAVDPHYIPTPHDPLYLRTADAEQQAPGVASPEVSNRPKDAKHQTFKRIKAKGPNARRLIKEAIEGRRAALEEREIALERFFRGDHAVEFPSECFVPHFVRAARGSP